MLNTAKQCQCSSSFDVLSVLWQKNYCTANSTKGALQHCLRCCSICVYHLDLARHMPFFLVCLPNSLSELACTEDYCFGSRLALTGGEERGPNLISFFAPVTMCPAAACVLAPSNFRCRFFPLFFVMVLVIRIISFGWLAHRDIVLIR